MHPKEFCQGRKYRLVVFTDEYPSLASLVPEAHVTDFQIEFYGHDPEARKEFSVEPDTALLLTEQGSDRVIGRWYSPVEASVVRKAIGDNYRFEEILRHIPPSPRRGERVPISTIQQSFYRLLTPR